MKNYLFSSILIIVISILVAACSSSNDSGECSSFLECLDGTYWTPNDNQSIWTFNDNQNGAYLEVYIAGNNCYNYENNFIVNAESVSYTHLRAHET